MRQKLVRDAATLVGYPDDHMLRSLADEHLDRRWLGIFELALLNHSLDRVSQELANDVL
jgi:hypothetical protein